MASEVNQKTGESARVDPRLFLREEELDSGIALLLASERIISDITRKAETALTLAACQYALDGIGIAWLPLSLAGTALKQGRLIRATLDTPDLMLDVRMIRLADPIRPAALDSWDILRDALHAPD